MALKIPYHEDALRDLEHILQRSLEKHPETTERFVADLFNRIDVIWGGGARIGAGECELSRLKLL
jgi:hypothetical protein